MAAESSRGFHRVPRFKGQSLEFQRNQQLGQGRYLFGPDEEQFHFGAYGGITTGV